MHPKRLFDFSKVLFAEAQVVYFRKLRAAFVSLNKSPLYSDWTIHTPDSLTPKRIFQLINSSRGHVASRVRPSSGIWQRIRPSNGVNASTRSENVQMYSRPEFRKYSYVSTFRLFSNCIRMPECPYRYEC